jgi:hypothetical protein
MGMSKNIFIYLPTYPLPSLRAETEIYEFLEFPIIIYIINKSVKIKILFVLKQKYQYLYSKYFYYFRDRILF